jgi:hypothetical protein
MNRNPYIVKYPAAEMKDIKLFKKPSSPFPAPVY